MKVDNKSSINATRVQCQFFFKFIVNELLNLGTLVFLLSELEVVSRQRDQQYSASMCLRSFPLNRFSISAMSWWKRSPCSSLYAPILSGKKSRWLWRKWIFSDINTPIAPYADTISATIFLYPVARWFPRKLSITEITAFHAFFCTVLNLDENSLDWISFFTWGPLSTPEMKHQTIPYVCPDAIKSIDQPTCINFRLR